MIIVQPELIREVDLGPFKHKVDDGLEIRKASYECMYTLLDSCLDRIGILKHFKNVTSLLFYCLYIIYYTFDEIKRTLHFHHQLERWIEGQYGY